MTLLACPQPACQFAPGLVSSRDLGQASTFAERESRACKRRQAAPRFSSAKRLSTQLLAWHSTAWQVTVWQSTLWGCGPAGMPAWPAWAQHNSRQAGRQGRVCCCPGHSTTTAFCVCVCAGASAAAWRCACRAHQATARSTSAHRMHRTRRSGGAQSAIRGCCSACGQGTRCQYVRLIQLGTQADMQQQRRLLPQFSVLLHLKGSAAKLVHEPMPGNSQSWPCFK